MNLPEALVYSDIRHLNRIADYNQLSVSTTSKNILIQSILEKLNDTRFVVQRLEELGLFEERLLLIILMENKKKFTIEDLLAKANIVLRMELQEAHALPSSRSLISTLMNNGWLFVDQRGRQQLYFMPEDLKSKLIKGLKQNNKNPTTYFPDKELILGQHAFLHDMVIFLRYVSHEIVPLTTGGTIHKRQQLEIFKRLSMSESPVDGKQWRFGYGRRFPDYPSRFALMYDYLFDKGLINEEINCLSITGDGNKVLHGDITITEQDGFHYWLFLYGKAIRNISFLVSLIEIYCSQWQEIEFLKEKIIVFIQEFYYDSKSDVLQKRVLEPLMWFGYLKTHIKGDQIYVRYCPNET